ncbi:MAG: class I SAM-dependent methyltransferase [Dehalococcoidia bacterium]|jgi:SAM-dependent methyltransferase|nr:class I SAM-dependent methyltransferase [Dehalococcoidia bacterium]
MATWFEDEHFWTELYPFMFPDKSFEAAGEQVEKIIRLAGLDPGGVLDLACGPGRHAVEFAKRGLQVTGVDLSSFLLDKARQHSNEQQVNVEWVQEDMRRFVRPGAFDLATNMFSSFGYFDNPADNLGVLRNVHTSLKDGGVIVLETAGKEPLARVFSRTTLSDLGDGRLVVRRHEITDDWSRIRSEWTVIEDGHATTFPVQHAVYSGQEIKQMLQTAGFDEIKLYGDLDGSEYGVEAKGLVVTARK